MSTNEKNVFATDLLQLQNKIKRDPSSYKDEFFQAFHNYESQLQIYLMKPVKQNKQLSDSVLFLANISHCFKEELSKYPQQLIDVLRKYANVLQPDMRLSFVRALILIRNKNLMEAIHIFELAFVLFKCNDKLLRKTLYTHLINDVKKMKTKLKAHKECAKVQQFVFTLIKDTNPNVAKYALRLLVDLYKKQLWNDAKTVNMISTGCFSRVTKVLVVALNFFLTTNSSETKDSDDDSGDEKTSTQLLLALRVGKKTQSRKKKTDRALKALKKEKKSKKNESYQHTALHLLYDPQDFIEKLFKEVEQTNESFEIKLMMIDLIARLIGVHSLYLLNFYSFLIRFLTPHQREVAKMLWFAAIASHEMVPPESIEQMITTIANNFITERNTSEVIAVGLNSIREICAKCPLAINEDLLGDLVQYKTYKDKAVSTAAKSLIQLFRDKNPHLLHRRDRGKPTEASRDLKVLKFGETDVKGYVPGAEIIDLEEAKLNDETKDQEEWEECSDEEEESDDDWVEVSHSSDEEVANGENKPIEVNPKDEADKEAKAILASTQRIFTQEDFKRIQQEQLRKKIEDSSKSKSLAQKRKATVDIEDSDSDDEITKALKRDGLVPLSSITYVNKKRKHDKESRVATIMNGREERGKFGQRMKDTRLGKSNKEKRKTKSFQMVRHKFNSKNKRSFRDKQIALRNSLMKQKKVKK